MRTLLTPVLMACAIFAIFACTTESSLSAPVPTSYPTPEVEISLVQAKVVSVIDGATIDAEIDNRIFRIRYLGIEIHGDRPSDDGGLSISQQAFEFNRFLVESQTVQLESDTVDTDPLGNLLRYVFVGGGRA